MVQNSTTGLDSVLRETRPDSIDHYLSDYSSDLIGGERPFCAYMHQMLREKGLKQQDVFLKADLPERYSYRLLSEEKHTRQRDYILRLCLASQFSLKETNRALKIYGMSELYSRIPRDAVLMIALNRQISDVEEVNRLLVSHGMEPLRASGSSD